VHLLRLFPSLLFALGLTLLPISGQSAPSEPAKAPPKGAPRQPAAAAPAPAATLPSVLLGEPDDLQRVAAAAAGDLTELAVKRGDRVTKGQLLGNLDEEREKFAAEAARIRADDQSALELALSEVELRQAELEEAEEAYRRRKVARTAISKAKAQLEMAKTKEQMARTNQKLAKLEAERQESELERRRFRSPMDGVVISVEKAVGDKIAQGTVVFTVGSGDSVALNLNLPQHLARELESRGGLFVRLKGELETRFARLVSTGPADPATGTVPVKLLTDAPAQEGQPVARPLEYELATPPPLATPAPAPGT